MENGNMTEYETGYWMPLRTVYKVSSTLSEILSLSGNFLLIWLVFCKTPRELRTYSRVLIQNAVVDILYTLICVITRAQIDFDKGVILMMMNGPLARIPNPWTFLAIDLYIIGLFSCVILLPVPFIFRFFTVCKNKVLTAWQYTAMLIICNVITLLYTGLHSWAFWPTEDKNRYVYIIDHEFWKDENGNLPYFVASDIKEHRIIVLVFFTMLFGMISYALVIGFNMCIMRVLARNANIMSRKTRAMQQQLGNVFKYQALVPFLICVTPLSFVFILCALGVRTAGKGSILTMIVGWIPVANPFSTIFFIRHYRRTVIKILPVSKCFKKRIEDAMNVKNSSTPSNAAPRTSVQAVPTESLHM